MEITRRDYFAAHAMKAVIDRIRSYEMAVEVAVKYADALIAELDKGKRVTIELEEGCSPVVFFQSDFDGTVARMLFKEVSEDDAVSVIRQFMPESRTGEDKTAKPSTDKEYKEICRKFNAVKEEARRWKDIARGKGRPTLRELEEIWYDDVKANRPIYSQSQFDEAVKSAERRGMDTQFNELQVQLHQANEELDGYREKAQPDTASGSEEVCDECKECLGLDLICPGNSYHPGRCPSFVPQPTEEELDPIKEQLKPGESE